MPVPRHEQTHRWLAIRLAERTYALPLEQVSDVAEARNVRTVAGRPRGVLGIHEWRGKLLTLLDLPELVDDRGLPGPPTLVRLAAPFDHTALYVPGPVRLRRSARPSDGEAVSLEPSSWIEELQDAQRHGRGAVE